MSTRDQGTGSAADRPSPVVGVSIRFVPTGIGADEQTLFGTLLLSPVAGGDATSCVHTVSLSAWPSAIEELLTRHGIGVYVAPARPDAPPAPPQAPTTPIGTARRAFGPARRATSEIGIASATWSRLIGWKTGDLDLLAHALVHNERMPIGREVAPDTAKSDVRVPDVIATGQGDAGLLLSLERSRSVLDRMRAKPAELPVPKTGLSRPGEALLTRPGKDFDKRKQHAPWLLTVTLPVPKPNPGETEAQRDARWELAREREQEQVRSGLTDGELSDRRKAADKQAAARRGYRSGAATADALRIQLEEMARHRTTAGRSPAAAVKAAAGSDDELRLQLDAARTLHYAGTRVDIDAADAPLACTPPRQDEQHALQRFYAIASQPKLARLFNLVIDVAIALSPEKLAELRGFPRVKESFDATRFVFASAQAGGACDRHVVWTVSKLRLPSEVTAGRTLFWPCTREEMDARCVGWGEAELLQAGLAAQVDGVLDLGTTQTADMEPHPRFDLLTLDPRRAMEADINADCQAAWREGEKSTTVGTVPEGGLVLVDRWRQYHAVTRAVDRAITPAPGPVVIDAEDLAVGVRLDIGLDLGGSYAWRSLVERRIAFADPSIESGVATLVPKAAQRDALDAAPLAVATRVRVNDKQAVGPAGPATAFTEEVVAQWLGEPLGVDLHAAARAADLQECGPNTKIVSSLIDLDMHYSLPTTGADRPFRYCFGWTVRVGARMQLEGGLARTLEAAKPIYDAAAGHSFSLPPSLPGVRGRRLLRHQRIEQPVVTTPRAILSRQVSGPQETALEMAVRSTVADGSVKPIGPETTHRILVPPPVSLEFADRHDVFDVANTETGPDGTVRPKGGLAGVDYDRTSFGTFPVWSTQAVSEGAVYPDWPAPALGKELDLARQPFPVPTGDAIFRPIETGKRPSDRPHPYYPDPAAELMVFRLRRENDLDIPGASLVVRVRRSGVAYPEVTPIAVQLVRVAPGGPLDQSRLKLDLGLNTAPATGHDGWQRAAAAVYLDGSATITRAPSGRAVDGMRVLAHVAPGERLQLDVWCLPRWQTLLALFDMVETSTLVVQAMAGQPNACLSEPAFIEALAKATSVNREKIIATMREVGDGGGSLPAGPCGPGMLPIPCRDHVGTIAALIQETARDVVTPELAARTTLWLTHAIDRPLQAPSFHLPGFEQPGVEPPLLPRQTQSFFPIQIRRVVDQGGGNADRVELSGSILVDRATSGFVEIRAHGASLVSGAFDDPRRGRSDDDQARGIWPSVGDDVGMRWRRPDDVFGFTVAPGGEVTLPSEQATLLRIDNLARESADGDLIDLSAVEAFLKGNTPAPAPPPGDDGKSKLPELKAMKDGGRPTRPHTINDAKARVLELLLIAGSRTAPLIRTADGEPLDEAGQTIKSTPVRLLLPASKAPARVAPLSIRPVFQTVYGGMTAVRTVRLRIRVRRPWFSSGVGERLGVVLWPPDFAARSGVGGTDRVARDASTQLGESRWMDMKGLSDLALGPGGEYVTRWGGDPTNGGPAPHSWLLPPSCFTQADFGRMIDWWPDQLHADAAEVIYVPRATMPLPLPPGATDGKVPTTMEVALLAFRPRFDVDLEHFYFDIEINPGAALEPFVRLGLVRYQANAPSDKRVSEPVVEWAQLLPSRRLEATIQRPQTGKEETAGGGHRPAFEPASHSYVVQASVTGQARHGSTALHAAGTLGARMQFGIYRADAQGRQICVARSSVVAETTEPTWRTPAESLRLDENPARPREDGVRYFLLASEHNEMLPASYTDEPFDAERADAEEQPAASGPRFAAWIALTPGAHEKPSSEPASRTALPIHRQHL